MFAKETCRLRICNGLLDESLGSDRPTDETNDSTNDCDNTDLSEDAVKHPLARKRFGNQMVNNYIFQLESGPIQALPF